MSLRHALLGLLAEKPRTGYELTRMFDVSLANVWAARHSQIYPELSRLTRDGMIERIGESGPRGSKQYTITDKGLEAVKKWLTDTEPSRTMRNETLLRDCFLWLIESDDARLLLQRDEKYYRQRVEAYKVASAALSSQETPAAKQQRMILESGIAVAQALADWSLWARRELTQ